MGECVMSTFINIAGHKFGRLMAVRVSPGNGERMIKWLCICECGNEKIISRINLRSGDTRSCGCLEKESKGNSLLTHSHTSKGRQSSEYMSWYAMIQRCTNSKHIGYKNYGGRGIKVCDRWLSSFENFLADIGKKPSEKYTIDRYPDNNGDYEPKNCRWATRTEQMRHTRRAIMVNYNNKEIPLAELALILGIKYKTLLMRHYRNQAIF